MAGLLDKLKGNGDAGYRRRFINSRPMILDLGIRFVKGTDTDAILVPKWQPVYNRVNFGVAANTYSMFGAANLGNNLISTNLSTANQLPKPTEFDIYGINLYLHNNTTAVPFPLDDFHRFLNDCHLRMFITQKEYLSVPVSQIPAGSHVQGLMSTTVNATTLQSFQNGAGWFPLLVEGEPIHILSQQEFEVFIQSFNAAVYSTTFNVTCFLQGIMFAGIL